MVDIFYINYNIFCIIIDKKIIMFVIFDVG